jgi:hypothetical protein
VHSNLQRLQSSSGICGQATLLAAQRSRGYSALLKEPGGAAAGRKSYSRLAKGEEKETKLMTSSKLLHVKAARVAVSSWCECCVVAWRCCWNFLPFFCIPHSLRSFFVAFSVHVFLETLSLSSKQPTVSCDSLDGSWQKSSLS